MGDLIGFLAAVQWADAADAAGKLAWAVVATCTTMVAGARGLLGVARFAARQTETTEDDRAVDRIERALDRVERWVGIAAGWASVFPTQRRGELARLGKAAESNDNPGAAGR